MGRELKYFLLLNVLPPLVYLFLRLLHATWRVRHVGIEAAGEMWRRDGNSIACFWHGRLLAMPFATSGRRAKVLISRHRDGEFIARVIRFFGLGSVRGSSGKSTLAGLREMLVDLKNGFDIAVTPDGPKGPRFVVKPGLIEVARLSGKPLLPVSYSASKKKS